MRLKKYKKILIYTAVVLLISNWQGMKNITGVNNWYYTYSNYGGSYTFVESPKLGYVITKRTINGSLSISNNSFLMPSIPKNDTIIYRLFAIKPYKFWRWGEYLFNWRYSLPYLNWEDVVRRRGFDKLKKSKGGMQF